MQVGSFPAKVAKAARLPNGQGVFQEGGFPEKLSSFPEKFVCVKVARLPNVVGSFPGGRVSREAGERLQAPQALQPCLTTRVGTQ